MALAIIFRLVWIQGLNAQDLANEAKEARTYTRNVAALRGDILDRDGKVLATSMERYDIWVNQLQVVDYKNPDQSADLAGVQLAARQLSPVLGMSVEELENILSGEQGFKYVKKAVNPQVNESVKAMNIPGIGSDRVQQRIYPAGEVGANVIGFVGSDGTALAGAELSFDNELSGEDGFETFERGAGGQAIPSGASTKTAAIDGKNIQLTIDQDIQYRAQELITEVVAKENASGGSIVIMNARTGELLALADTPTFDPNNPGASPSENLGNQAISNVFEPGSSGKLFTVAAALEEKKVSNQDRFYSPDSKDFNGEIISDAINHQPKNYTLAGILKDSSNVGIVQVGQRVEPEVLHSYFEAFGIGTATNIGLPGESAGILHPAENWVGRNRLVMNFGQGYSTTALQITSAVAIFFNDGLKVEPTIIKTQGKNAKEQISDDENRVISAETAKMMREYLDNNIDDENSPAAVAGYAVGAKTGTAEEISKGTLTLSIIGSAPMDNPQIVVGVFIYGAHGGFGGTVAAPVFSEMMSYVLQVEGISPTGKGGIELRNEWD